MFEVLDDTGHAAFAVDEVRAASQADPRLAGRLALWGRRLVGEALTQAMTTASERTALLALVLGGYERGGGAALDDVGVVFSRITDNHARRMAALGLAA